MRFVRFFSARRRVGDINQHPSLLDLDWIGWYGILFEAWFSEPRLVVKAPLVPWADDVFAFELAVAERPSHMVACRSDCSELAVVICQCVSRPPDRDGLNGANAQRFGAASVLPVRLFCHSPRIIQRQTIAGGFRDLL